jgi:hypothetical protein
MRPPISFRLSIRLGVVEFLKHEIPDILYIFLWFENLSRRVYMLLKYFIDLKDIDNL